MKKSPLVMIGIIASVFALSSCESSNSFNNVDQIKANNVLKVATNAEFPPFEYKDGDAFKGIDMDVIRLFGKHLNVKTEIKNMDFDASLLSVSSNKVDLAIAAITKNAKREETLSFSNSYYTANQVVIVKSDSKYASLTNKDDILLALSNDHAKIGCQRGTTGEYYIRGDKNWDFDGITNTTCKAYDNGALAMTDLTKGNLNAVIIDLAPAKLYEKNFKNTLVLDPILTQEEYCIAISKGNESLVKEVNLFIETIKGDGTYDKILDSYFGDGDEIIIDTNESMNASEATIAVLKGLGITMLITFLAFIIGITLGLLLTVVENINSDHWAVKILKGIGKVYVDIFRGTPVAVQLLIIYYVIFASINPLFAAIITFGLNSGAYVSEIIRGGLNAVPKGQMEAGRSLGLSYTTVMRKVVFPQTIRNCFPSLCNEFVSLIKETSIVSFITVIDLYAVFRAIATATFNYQAVYLIMGVVYFVLIFVISHLLKLLEKGLNKHVEAK